MSKAETVLDATPNVGTKKKTDSDSGPTGCLTKTKSFSADTGVLLADGSVKPISEVGDEVWATDPETGESAAREVTAVWPHDDLLVELETSAGSVVTTEDHHFWNETDREWAESRGIDLGDELLTAGDTTVSVVGLD